MKTTTVLTLLPLALACGCASAPVSDRTIVKVGGTDGTAFTGYFVEGGQRIPLSGTIPFTFVQERLSELEIRKTDPAQSLQIAAQNDVEEWHREAYSKASPDVDALRVVVHDGLVIEKLKR